MKNGYFITLEGADGCGKTTQAHLLEEYFQNLNHSVVLTREPGGTPLAEEIRRIILTPSKEPLTPLTEILLYAASRAQHVHQLIQPALEEGKIVISERFIDSSLAYQGYALGWDLNLIGDINKIAAGGLEPDLTFLLDANTERSISRLNNRLDANQTKGDRIESRGYAFQEKVRQGYLQLARHNPRIVVIDTTTKNIQSIHAELIHWVGDRLSG
ncbi:MAG TPA: dTMP kinase [Firmicutes bacterium]|jgi:dTMP kinase|nr:dTMP kinase [Bacillota bacterium]